MLTADGGQTLQADTGPDDSVWEDALTFQVGDTVRVRDQGDPSWRTGCVELIQPDGLFMVSTREHPDGRAWDECEPVPDCDDAVGGLERMMMTCESCGERKIGSAMPQVSLLDPSTGESHDGVLCSSCHQRYDSDTQIVRAAQWSCTML